MSDQDVRTLSVDKVAELAEALEGRYATHASGSTLLAAAMAGRAGVLVADSRQRYAPGASNNADPMQQAHHLEQELCQEAREAKTCASQSVGHPL